MQQSLAWLLAFFAIIICGCSTRPDATSVRMFGEHCESEGHVKDSSEYFECVKRIASKR